MVNVTHQSAVIRWVTDEPATGVIEYGTTVDLGLNKSRATLARRHNLTLVGLEPDTTYYFCVHSTDTSGNGPSASEVYSFHTELTQDTRKPVILEGPNVIYKTDDSATIHWLTDEPGDSVVDYGEGLGLNLRVSDGARSTEHQITLADLTPGRSYSYAVSSTDLAGNTVTEISSTEQPAPAAGPHAGPDGWLGWRLCHQHRARHHRAGLHPRSDGGEHQRYDGPGVLDD